MDGYLLRFYVEENQEHDGRLIWEWLLAEANRLGLRGGSAFHAIGGFGRGHVLHESRFFELAGETGVEVEFIASDDETARLLDSLERQQLRLFYARIPASFGVLNPDVGDDPAPAVSDVD